MAEYFTLQWRPASRAYAMQVSFARAHPMDGPGHILESGTDDDTLDLMLDTAPDGRTASVVSYSCVDLPPAFREAQGIGGKPGWIVRWSAPKRCAPALR